MFALGVVFVLFATVSLGLITLSAAAVKARLLGSATWQAATRWASGLILIGLGVRLALMALSKAR